MGGGGFLGLGPAPSAPAAPNYAAAAQQTAAGNLETARAAAAANRVNQITPYGSLVYSQQGTFNPTAYEQAYQTYQRQLETARQGGNLLPEGYSFESPQGNLLSAGTAVLPRQGYRYAYSPTGERIEVLDSTQDIRAPRVEDFLTAPANPDQGWTARQVFSPDQQALYDYDIAASKGLGQLSLTGLDYVRQMMANPFSTQGLPSLQSQVNLAQLQQITGAPQLGQMGATPQAMNIGQAAQAQGVGVGEQAQRVGQGPQLSALETARALRQAGPTENLQRSLGENVGMSGWDRASGLIMQRLEPQLQRQQQSLDAQLAAQGIPLGSEAYTRAKQDLAMQQNDARIQAQLQAQGIQQNLFGQELAAGQFGNQATTQQQQNLLQNLGFSNQAQQQDYANRQAQLAFNNQMGQQGYQNQLAAQQANNAAIAQNFGQGLSAQQLQNQAAQQNYANLLSGTGFNAEQQQQQFANQMAALGYNNQQIQQMYQNQVAQQQANNAIAQQLYGNQFTAADLANRARQQGFGELSYMRNEPLNTLNAVRSGAQVQGPQFVNVPQQATTSGADYLSAAQMGYNAQMGDFNAQQAAQANLNAGLFGLGGAGIMAFSDPRLKQNIKAVGVLPNGLTLYSFEYKDEIKQHPLAGEGVHVGVMADEVEQVFPYAVTTLNDGYKIVNYGLLP